MVVNVPSKRKSGKVTGYGFSTHNQGLFFVLGWYWYIFLCARDGVMKTTGGVYYLQGRCPFWRIILIGVMIKVFCQIF